jgi:hypothetical protein
MIFCSSVMIPPVRWNKPAAGIPRRPTEPILKGSRHSTTVTLHHSISYILVNFANIILFILPLISHLPKEPVM